MLIGFTVMQHAFAGGAFAPGLLTDTERKALALTGSGDVVWDWDVPADRIYVSPEADTLLGVKRGTLDGPASRWLDLVHVLDRDRFRTALDAVIDHRRGRVGQEFRIRAADGHYMWLNLKARPVVGSDGEVVRCVGTISDVTEQKTCGGTSPARCGARQSHRPAQSRALPRPAGGGADLRAGRTPR